jgi:alpha-glucosidase
MFGDLDDFRALVSACHACGLRLVIDQVYSHSSDQHPWFIESATSRSGPRADWYVWADPGPDGGPPNNWLGRFGGYAWEWSPTRRQYYLHNFLIEQPDLNLHNPEVQQEALDIMRFWFDLGVDGLRLDVANFFMHDPALRDNPPVALAETPANPYYMQAHVYDRSRPENLPFLKRMREVADGAGERMLLAEISCDHQVERMAEYTTAGRLHTAYSFALQGPRLDGRQIDAAVREAGAGDSWPTWSFSSHDVRRVASRWDAENDPARLRMLQALLLCLRGTIVLYQGEELGLPHADVPRERLRDPESIRFWPHHRGRDGARTPMPWREDGVSLGFSTVDGWLPVDTRHAALAVSRQERDEDSHLAHCRGLLALRRREAALRLGGFEPIAADEEFLAFRRVLDGVALVCAFNLGAAPRAFSATGEVLAGALQNGALAAGHYVILRER